MSVQNEYVTKDSGQREQHDTGAQRDIRTGKGRYDLITPFGLRRLALVMERGADKYADRNWESGMPYCRCLDSALRHIMQFIAGDDDEDHLGHATFNLMAVMHYQEMVARGKLSQDLDDRPEY